MGERGQDAVGGSGRGREVSVEDLSKQGVRSVKVLRERELGALIERAVNEALQANERQRAALLARSGRARRREADERRAAVAGAAKVKRRIDELCQANGKLEIEIRSLRGRATQLEQDEAALRERARFAAVRLIRWREAQSMLDAEQERAQSARERTAELDTRRSARARSSADVTATQGGAA